MMKLIGLPVLARQLSTTDDIKSAVPKAGIKGKDK